MPLTRHFTLRLGRRDVSAAPSRTSSVRKEISLPVNLLSSTQAESPATIDLDQARENMTTAAPASPIIADTSRPSSDQDSTPSSPDTPNLTDASSFESSPMLECNHLSAYFPIQFKTGGMLSHASPPPAVPRRVPSHSKQEHERLARKRSLRSSQTSQSSSDQYQSDNVVSPLSAPASSSAMEQVVEDAREEEEQDAVYMRRRGLQKIDASSYSDSIGSLRWSLISTSSQGRICGWI